MNRRLPVRTCVGCREKAVKSSLLRVVVEATEDRSPDRLVPDEDASRPGRGAYVHPDLACLELAERRRAFPRALRADGPLDSAALRQRLRDHRDAPPGRDVPNERKRSSCS